ncbi:MAG: hypothetical protein MZU79_09090 [Anaerotruncus sp.]|nr:hypothetical protein [Anaerotruncus sp.]
MAEDPNVMLPVAVNLDGFILTHMIEPVEYEDDELDQAVSARVQDEARAPSRQARFHGVLRRCPRSTPRPRCTVRTASQTPTRTS